MLWQRQKASIFGYGFIEPSGDSPSIFDSQDQKLPLRDTVSKAYDAHGNLTEHSGKTYDYDIFNKLTSVAGTSAQSGNMLNVTYAYDAKGRLLEENDAEIGTITRFAYSGTQLISEFNTNNTVQRRYVHGPGVDEPIVVYEGSGTVNKSWMMADHQGSIIGYTNGNGAVTNINTYTMEGVPGDNNVGRFGYTGQMWLEGAELYHYKARAYDPQLGRFLQADPIGYGDGLNMYAYVGGDAMNSIDPSGTSKTAKFRDRKCYSLVDAEGNHIVGSERCTGGSGSTGGGIGGGGGQGTPGNNTNILGGPTGGPITLVADADGGSTKKWNCRPINDSDGPPDIEAARGADFGQRRLGSSILGNSVKVNGPLPSFRGALNTGKRTLFNTIGGGYNQQRSESVNIYALSSGYYVSAIPFGVRGGLGNATARNGWFGPPSPIATLDRYSSRPEVIGGNYYIDPSIDRQIRTCKYE